MQASKELHDAFENALGQHFDMKCDQWGNYANANTRKAFRSFLDEIEARQAQGPIHVNQRKIGLSMRKVTLLFREGVEFCIAEPEHVQGAEFGFTLVYTVPSANAPERPRRFSVAKQGTPLPHGAKYLGPAFPKGNYVFLLD